MHPYYAFLIWWGVTVLFVFPFEIVYLASNVKRLSMGLRVLYKCFPVLFMALSLLLALAVGIAQRTPYTGLVCAAFVGFVVGDICLCLADYNIELRQKRNGYMWRGGGVVAFGLAHILLIIAFTISPTLSAGMDDGPPHPLQILLAIPFMIGALLLLAFLIYLRKVSSVEIVFITLYGFLLASVCWRAASRISVDLENEYLSSQIMSLVGMVLFAISDFGILIDTYLYHTDYSKLWIMSLYWIAVTLLYLASFLFKK